MGTRGPPAKPTHLKLLRGNPGCRALNQHEPRPGLLANPPPPPDTLTGYARDEWDRIIGELYHLKLVTAVDIHPLAAYCEAYKRWKTAVRTLDEMAERDPVMRGQIVKTQSGGAAPNPIVMIADKAARDMVRFAGEFGLTPAARSRISTEPDDPTDKFRRFIAR
jgi:P27 family predicted phage terminase small subunit